MTDIIYRKDNSNFILSMNGLNIFKGMCTQREVASDLGIDFVEPKKVLN